MIEALGPDHEVGCMGHADEGRMDELARHFGIDFGEFLARQRPFLTCSHVDKLLADGSTIGAYRLDQPLYRDLQLIDPPPTIYRGAHLETGLLFRRDATYQGDITEDPAHWRNACYARFWGLESIVAVPGPAVPARKAASPL